MSILDMFKRKNFSTPTDDQSDRRQSDRSSALEAKMHQGYEPDASYRERGNLYSNITFDKYSSEHTDDNVEADKRSGIAPSKSIAEFSNLMNGDNSSQSFMSANESGIQQGGMGNDGSSGFRSSGLQSNIQSSGLDTAQMNGGGGSDSAPSNNNGQFGRSSTNSVTTGGGNPEGSPPTDPPEEDDDGDDGNHNLDLQTSPANGQEGVAIPLNIVTDYDGDASDLQYSISGVISGATLSAGQNMGGGLWILTASQITNLFLIPPAYFSGSINLTVTATADDGGNILTENSGIVVSISGVASTPVLTVQNATGNEDTAVPLLVNGATSDPSGETLSVVIGNVPAGATLSAGVNNGNATWTLLPSELNLLTLTPPSNFSGSINLTVTAISSENGTTSQTTSNMNVTIGSVADAPNVSASPVTATEDTPAALNITASLNDTDGSEILFVTVGGMPAGATLSAGTNNGNGTWTLTPAQLSGLMITPAPNFSGSFNLSISATASENGTTATTSLPPLAVSVAGVADTPNLSLANVSGAEDTAISLGIASSLHSNAGTEVLSIVISGVPTGATLSAGTNNGGGVWTVSSAQLSGLSLTPPQNFSGQINIVVTAIATEGGTTAQTDLPMTIMVSGVADTPNLVVQSVNGNEGSPIALNIAASLHDTDGSEILSIIINNVPTGVTLSAGTDNGDGSWTLTQAQLSGLMLYPLPQQSGEILLSVTAISSENGTTAQTSAVSMSVMVDGIANVPNLTVQPASGVEDTATALNIAASLNDTDGSELLFVVVGNMPSGSSLSAGINNGNGTWTLTPAQLSGLSIIPPLNFSGTINLTISAISTEDGTSAHTDMSLPVTISGVADVPSVTVQPSAGPAGTSLPLDIQASLTDTDGSETLSVIIGNVPAGGVLSAGIDNGDGTWTLTAAQLSGLTITPPAFYSGTLNLSVVAVASENATTAQTVPVTLPVYVGGTADAPTLTVSAASGTEDTAIPLTISAALTDNDGSETLSLLISNMPAGATLSAGINNGNGTWTLTPAQLSGLTLLPPANFSGHFDLTVSAISHEGQLTNQIDDILGVDVAGVADAPIVNAPPVSGNEDTAITLNMTAILADTDGSEILSIVIGNVPSGGMLSAGVDNGNGTWTLTGAQITGLTYTPPTNVSGTVNLSVTATASENGTTATTVSNIAITVEGVADTPNVSVSPASGNENTAIALNIAASLNDTDGSEILSIVIGNMPTGGILSAGINNGNGTWTLTPSQLTGLTYTPPANSSGIVNLSVTATASENGTTSSSSSNLAVSVAGVATTPILSVSAANGNEDTAIALNIAASLADTDGSETLSIVIGNMPTGAVLSAGVNNGNGTWTLTPAQLTGLTYTPPLNASGVVNLSVTATSFENATTATTVSSLMVTVQGVADAPNISVTPASGNENAPIALNITASLNDTDGSESLSIRISGVPAGASLSSGLNTGGGVWVLMPTQLTGLTYTPPLNASGVVNLSVAATASENGTTSTVSSNLAVSVSGVATTPILSVSAASGNEDTAISLNIVASLTDNDGSEILSIVIGNVPTGAVLSAGVNNGNGTWTLTTAQLSGLTYTPPLNASGIINLSVTATSSENGTTAATTSNLAVTVGGVADAPNVSVTPASGNENATIALNIAASLNDTDGSEILSIVIGNMPTGATLSAGINNGNGTWTLTPAQLTGLTYTPPLNASGVVNLSVAATAFENGTTSTVSSNLAVSVSGVATTPILSVSAASGNEDTAISLNIAASLTDNDGSEILSIMIGNVPTGAVLSAGINNGNGTWTLTTAQLTGLTYTPPLNASGTVNLSVTATSSENATTATISTNLPVTVAGIADAPSLVMVNANGTENVPVALNITALLTDTDGSETLSVTISGVPSGASLSAGLNAGAGVWVLTPAQLAGLTLIPATNYNGAFALTVVALSSEGGTTASVSASLPVTIAGVASTPTLVVSAATGLEDNAIPLVITAGLADTSEVLSIVIGNVPAGATLSHGLYAGGGKWSLSPSDLAGLTITPPLHYSGPMALTVTAISTENNGADASFTVALNVTVTPVVDAPTLSTVAVTGNEDGAISLNIAAALTDTSEILSVTISGVPTGAILSAGTNLGAGVWSLSAAQLVNLKVTPPANSDGDFTLNIVARSTESNGATTTVNTTLAVTVNGVADVPTVTASNAASLGNQVNLTISGALTDTDGSETISYVVHGVPDGFALSAGINNGDNTWTLRTSDLSGLKMTAPEQFNGQLNLNVTAVSHDSNNSVAISAPTPFYARFANYASGYLVDLGIGVNVGGIGVGVHVGVLPDIDLLPATGGLLGTNGIYTKEDTSFLIADAPNLLAIPVVSAVLALLSKVQFSGVPIGVTFSNGTNMGGGVWQFTQAQLNNLYLNPLPNSDVDFTIVMSLKLILGADVALFSVPVHMMGVADMPTLTVSAGTGAEDTAIALNISGALTDVDGSESLSFLVSGMPAGFTLNHGINNGNGAWSLLSSDLSGLTITPATNYSGTANITVSAIATEREGDQTVRQQSVSMVVTAAVDTAIVSPVSMNINEGQAVTLNLGISLRDTDGSETISAVTISGLPAGSSLLGATDNHNGTWSADVAHLNQVQFIPSSNYSGDVTLNIDVTSRETSTGATTHTTSNLSLHIAPVADTPIVTALDATGDSGSSIQLSLGAGLTDTDGSESLTAVISGVPDGALLSAGLNNGDGTWTLSDSQLSGLSIIPPDGFVGDMNMTMTAYSRDGSSSVASAQQNFSVHVMPAPAAMMSFSMMDNDSLLSGGWVDMNDSSFDVAIQAADFFADSSASSVPDNNHDQAFQNNNTG